MSYVFQPYPSWRYHATADAKLVNSEDEDKALGPGWHNSPALAKAAPAAEVKPSRAEAKAEVKVEPKKVK